MLYYQYIFLFRDLEHLGWLKEYTYIKNLIVAFISGGLLGSICETIYKILIYVSPLSKLNASLIITSSIIIITSLLTSIGIFDNFISKCRSGLIIPTTGFAHSISSSLVDIKKMDSEEEHDFYYYNGYGLGPDFDGVILCIFCDYGSFYIYPFGKVAETLQDTNLKRLKGHLEDKLYYYDMAETFLDELEHMEKTGRIPRDAGQWLFCAIVSVLVGAFVGKKFLNKARKNMVTVRSVYGADNYVTSSSDFRTGNDTFINRNVQKTKIPRTTYSSGSSSSRSSSSGRSTYHSSSRGSSGRTHTGSGRRF